jgi:hypothetical protein
MRGPLVAGSFWAKEMPKAAISMPKQKAGNWSRLCAIDHHDHRRVVELDNKDNAEHYDRSGDGFDHTDARGLIKLIGTDWNSLLLEARFLKERH